MVELTPVARLIRRRRLRLLVILSIVVVLGGAGLGLLAGLRGWDAVIIGGSYDGSRSWVGSVLILVGFLIEIVGLIRLVRRQRGNERWNSPLLGLTRERRHVLRQQVRGRVPVDARSLPLVLHLAQTTVRDLRNLTPVLLGLVVMNTGQLISRQVSVTWALSLLATLLIVSALIWGRRDVRRASAFLESRPDDRPGRALR